MYKRNRQSAEGEQYRENLPPVYSGSLFRSSACDAGVSATDTRPHTPPLSESEEKPTAGTDAEPPTEVQEAAEEVCVGHGGKSGIFGGLSQEELILIGLLLLLSAEHERSMDVIVILLLLLGIK